MPASKLNLKSRAGFTEYMTFNWQMHKQSDKPLQSDTSLVA